jgi:anti-sigma-K factor RskA
MHDELLGYALQALEADEIERLERRLGTDLEIRRKFEIIRLALVPLEADFVQSDPPAGLAARTCEQIRKLCGKGQF